MFFDSAGPAPAPTGGNIAWLQRRLARVWNIDPLASRLDAETPQGIRGAWGAAPDATPAAQKARLLLSLAAVRRPVSAEVLDESASLVVDLLRDHATSSDGPLVRTAAGLLHGLCPPLCDPASLRTEPIEEQAPVLLAQATEDLDGIAAEAAKRVTRAVAAPLPGGPDRPPSLASRPLLLQELPLEARFVGVAPGVWAATAHRPGAHFAVSSSAAARLRSQVSALSAASAAQLGVVSAGAHATMAASQAAAAAAEDAGAGSGAAEPAAAAAVAASERAFAAAESALAGAASALLTALRGGKPLVEDPSSAAGAAAGGLGGAPRRAPAMPAAVGRLAPSAARRAAAAAATAAASAAAATGGGALRNYKRRREGYEVLEVGGGGGDKKARLEGAAAAAAAGAPPEPAAAAAAVSVPPPSLPQPAPPPLHPPPSHTPPFGFADAAAAAIPSSFAFAGPGAPSQPVLPPPAAAVSYSSGGGGGGGGEGGGMVMELSLGGLEFSDLAGLMGAPPAPYAKDPPVAAAAAPVADAAAAERAADARRLIAGALAEHAGILSDADRALLDAFTAFLSGDAAAAAGRPASEEVRLDAMSFRKAGAEISGRNVLVLDWAAGAAKKVFRKGLA